MSAREDEARQRACDVMIAIQNAPAHKFGAILLLAFEKAIRETNEECAVIADENGDVHGNGAAIAAAIRARGAS